MEKARGRSRAFFVGFFLLDLEGNAAALNLARAGGD
jgi:hypothetical protein